MSAGALVGTIFNFFIFAVIWFTIGFVFDKIGVIFNTTIRLMPTMQDAVNGFALTQIIYGILPVIVFFALFLNYIMVEFSQQGGEV